MEILGYIMDYATRAHHGQKRKYTGAPYIQHPFAVAGLVSAVTKDEAVIGAAFLHDVVEDCDVTLSDISNRFGQRIANYVEMVSDVTKVTDGNRAYRKGIEFEHLKQAHPEAMTIKLADIIDNTSTISLYAPAQFKYVYREEILKILTVLGKGDKNLYAVACDLAIRM